MLKGFQQNEGINYTYIFSSVFKLATIWSVLSIVTADYLDLEYPDVNTAFLHGDLEEDIYIQQLENFAKNGKENLVCKLKNNLYGLKQAPRQWYKEFDGFMKEIGYHKCNVDPCC